MATLRNLKDLFIHHVKDLYNAESQLEKVIPKLIAVASDDLLRDALETHSVIVKENQAALKEIASVMEFDVMGEQCNAMEGIIRETNKFLEEEDADEHTRDAGIIADINRITHYFIAGYGGISSWARELDLDMIVRENCKKCIANVGSMDNQIKNVAKSRVNVAAH